MEPSTFNLDEKAAMELALEEAKKGLGYVSPNPPVGAVILDCDSNLVGKGYHRKYGSNHAETEAINSVQDKGKLKGANMFVTLEPCAHKGQTPSCAEMLAKLPIASLTFGAIDPNQKVNGKGLEILNASSVKVQQDLRYKAKCEELAEIFIYNQVYKLPFIAIKIASSLDGQIAIASSFESQWITGEESRNQAHYLRGVYDSTLVGANTFLKDNPRLNNRHDNFKHKKNKIILADKIGNLKIENSNLIKKTAPENIFIIGPKSYFGCHHINVEPSFSREEILKALNLLFKTGIKSILVEGGAKTISMLLKYGLVQRVYNFMAPCIIGSQNGISWTNGLEISELSNKILLKNLNITNLGQDLLLSARI